MKVLMPLNKLANRCGHFFNYNLAEGFEDKPDVNNGYNCDHPQCGEEQEGIGCCMASACPMAYPADGLVCQKAGVSCEYCGTENCECDDDMMVVAIADADYNDSFMYKLPNN